MGERLIKRNKSVIVSADVDYEKLPSLVEQTCLVEGIGGYKVGIELALESGLPNVIAKVRDHTELPIIYDHQKAGNDIPSMGAKFARVCKEAGVNSVILFPFSGPVSERAWIKASQDAGLHIIVGAHMTHPGFLKSQGGFISNTSPTTIFETALSEGVTDFVVPGNNPEAVKTYKALFDAHLGKDNSTLYAPGFIAQDGKISDFAEEAGPNWHAIVGRAIYQAQDINGAAQELTSQLNNG